MDEGAVLEGGGMAELEAGLSREGGGTRRGAERAGAWDGGSIALKLGKVVLQHHAEGDVVSLVLAGTKGQQGGQGFKLVESFNPIHQKKALEKHFLVWLVVHKLDSVGEGCQVAASNDQCGLMNCLPLCFAKH
jgi:hypothetical protein